MPGSKNSSGQKGAMWPRTVALARWTGYEGGDDVTIRVPEGYRYGPDHGRPLAVLLPELRLPRARQAGRGKPDRLPPLRPRQVAAHAPLPHLQGPLLRTQGDAAVRLAPSR